MQWTQEIYREKQRMEKVCTLPITYRVSARANLGRQLRLEVSVLEISSSGDIPRGVLLYARSVFEKKYKLLNWELATQSIFSVEILCHFFFLMEKCLASFKCAAF